MASQPGFKRILKATRSISFLPGQMDDLPGARRLECGRQELDRQQAELAGGMHRALAEEGIHELSRREMNRVELIVGKWHFLPNGSIVEENLKRPLRRVERRMPLAAENAVLLHH